MEEEFGEEVDHVIYLGVTNVETKVESLKFEMDELSKIRNIYKIHPPESEEERRLSESPFETFRNWLETITESDVVKDEEKLLSPEGKATYGTGSSDESGQVITEETTTEDEHVVFLLLKFLSNNIYVTLFLIPVSIILNGSLLSLVHAVLLFGWGAFMLHRPTRRFWNVMIFYTMFELVVKYAFQFHKIPYWKANYDINSGLYPPRLIGIEFEPNFVGNSVVFIFLLISLLVQRELTPVSVCRFVYSGASDKFKGPSEKMT